MSQPLFTISIVHYQGSVTDEEYHRCIYSIFGQSFKDFEILSYHDGPLSRSNYAVCLCRPTDTRANDFGHSLRDLAIKEAQGRYILFLNADNVLYPNALEEIAAVINRPRLWEGDEPNAIIYPILMKGCTQRWNGSHHVMVRDKRAVDLVSCVLTGFPPVLNSVDCMQFVGRVDLWREMGGWHDRSETSDGKLFQEFAERWGYRVVNKVLGEHR